jgi:hypothetical protein
MSNAVKLGPPAMSVSMPECSTSNMPAEPYGHFERRFLPYEHVPVVLPPKPESDPKWPLI